MEQYLSQRTDIREISLLEFYWSLSTCSDFGYIGQKVTDTLACWHTCIFISDGDWFWQLRYCAVWGTSWGQRRSWHSEQHRSVSDRKSHLLRDSYKNTSGRLRAIHCDRLCVVSKTWEGAFQIRSAHIQSFSWERLRIYNLQERSERSLQI